MPPKKKKDPTKDMTEEEKAAYWEAKKAEEEEILKNQERALLDFLKEKVAREDKYTKTNMLKIQEKWRIIMRDIKSDSLKKEINSMQQNFERVIDNKDYIIRALQQDLEEAEEQYQMAHRTHLEKLDELCSFQKKRLTKLDDHFDDVVNTMETSFYSEMKEAKAAHEKDVQYWTEVMYAMELQQDEKMENKRKEYQSKMDEIKNKTMDEKHALRDQKNEETQVLIEEFYKEKENYAKQTDDRKSLYETLKQRDIKNSATINKQMKILQKLQDSISQYKNLLVVNTKEHESETQSMKEKIDSVDENFKALKAHLSEEREIKRKELTEMVIQSNKTVKELIAQKDKGAKVLRLYEMCRKLETEEEKVLPFYAQSLTEEEKTAIQSLIDKEPSSELSKSLEHYEPMDNFWQRVNKVTLDVHALEKEKDQLESENKQLRSILKKYLDGISVSDEILSRANPLMNCTTSPITLTSPREKIRERRQLPIVTAVVEAAHVVKHTI